jgi:hypothetical protein
LPSPRRGRPEPANCYADYARRRSAASPARRGEDEPDLSHCAHTPLCRLSFKGGIRDFQFQTIRTPRAALRLRPAQTGTSIEVFYADRALETFGGGGAGWFWWSRERGHPPRGPATGPFPTSYIATRCIRLSRPTLGNDQGCGVVGAGLGGFRCAGRARCGRQCHRTMLSTAERDRTEMLRLTFSRPPSRPFQEGRACADRIKVSRAENAVSLQEQDTNRTRKGRLPR